MDVTIGTRKPRKESPWNRCDDCGRFIAYEDFDNGAIRSLATADTAFSSESYLTLCKACNRPTNAAGDRTEDR